MPLNAFGKQHYNAKTAPLSDAATTPEVAYEHENSILRDPFVNAAWPQLRTLLRPQSIEGIMHKLLTPLTLVDAGARRLS